MTNHVAKLYAVALALVVFFVTWAGVAARPWATEAEDPRLVALERRELRLRRERARVQRVLRQRVAAYQVRLNARQREIAAARAAAPAPVAAPSVGVVSLPPVTATRSS